MADMGRENEGKESIAELSHKNVNTDMDMAQLPVVRTLFWREHIIGKELGDIWINKCGQINEDLTSYSRNFDNF